MLIPLFASVAPFLAWPLEMVFPYPYVIEELIKGIFVIFILKSSHANASRIKLAVLTGLLFSFSESVMYISNIALMGTLWTFVERLLLTIPLHAITTLIILLPALKRKQLLPLGLAAAMFLHYFFNLFIAGL
jgi:hypothetical protein